MNFSSMECITVYIVYNENCRVVVGKLKKKKSEKFFDYFFVYQRCEAVRQKKKPHRQHVVAVTLAIITLNLHNLLYIVDIVINRVLPFPHSPQ